ncbi:cytochrome P450 26B1 [Lates japonicus]|uniref:Cytochrome P450 26B1 n=1 Tax=Lates japonicus TaxID=270547 RepID=A0AAD3N781_LATJO|nr:cytochrome P450 26B1 [Lates japonicus]
MKTNHHMPTQYRQSTRSSATCCILEAPEEELKTEASSWRLPLPEGELRLDTIVSLKYLDCVIRGAETLYTNLRGPADAIQTLNLAIELPKSRFPRAGRDVAFGTPTTPLRSLRMWMPFLTAGQEAGKEQRGPSTTCPLAVASVHLWANSCHPLPPHPCCSTQPLALELATRRFPAWSRCLWSTLSAG